MKKTKKLINKLVEELERTPLIQTACEKIGITRNTFYRWVKEDEELFKRVNEALSLGTGLVNDVAISNVLSGIKNKDPMFTKYWLDRKHPDFRKPYIYKIDSEDFLQYQRLLNEKEQAIRVDMEALDLAKRPQREKIEEATRVIDEWQAKWLVVDKERKKKEAQRLFEQWKNEYLEKHGYKDDDIPST
jgi:hypothetical protein